MNSVLRRFQKVENGLAYLFIVVLALVPTLEMIARSVFKTGFPGSFGNLALSLLVVAFLAGMIAARSGEHLNVALVHYVPEGRAKRALAAVAALVSVVILTMLTFTSLAFVEVGLTGAASRGLLPDQVVAWIMPLAFAAMTFRMARVGRANGSSTYLPLLGVPVGMVLALPSLLPFFWSGAAPAWAGTVADWSLAFYGRFGPLSAAFFVLAAFAGTPLFVVMAGAALFLIGSSGGELLVVPNQIFTQLTNTSLPAIPLFTVVGFMLSESRAGERLVGVFRSMFGWIPGGVIIATVGVCAFFTTFTGGSGVTILALGGLLSKILLEANYPKKFVYGLLTSVGSIGILFPPSLPIILVGVSTGTSVLKMFAGGLLPGLLLVIAMSGYGVLASIRNRVPVSRFSLKDTLRSIKESIWELLLPVLLIAGYFSGIFSIVETAAVSLLYTIVVEVLITRDIPFRGLGKVFLKALPIIGGILAILAASQALSYYIVDAEIPQALTHWATSVVHSPILFILLLNIVLIVAGAFMEIYASIIILLPLIGPLGVAYGIDPVHLGIIFLMNMEVAFLFPPVGLNILLASYRFKAPFTDITRSVLPFLLIQVVVVLIVSYFPWLTTALARLF
ncbi:MAG: TRAP transporter large permease subunit [Spirochaetota bacterium]